ncbi:MAG: BON domain-containing protein [Thermodesulfobacteriota bacterium]|nr:BON domain-containing protein [Thermodesulfobacteriota bacterium]
MPSQKVPVVFLSLLSSFFFLLSAFCFIPDQCWGEVPARITLETTSPQKLSLVIGKSVIIRSTEPVKRVSLGAPEIADALVLTAWQISLIGKAPGVTNLTLWGLDNKVSAILDLEVSPDISRLKEMIAKILPEEKDIGVMATHDNITLSGIVSSSSKRDQVLGLAESYFPKKVVNLLKIEVSPDVSRLKEMLQKILPEEKDIRVTATLDHITLSGTVSNESNLSHILAIAESYFPKKVVNLLKVSPQLDLEVSRGVSRLKETLHKILPEEKDIKVTATHDHITLSGTVSSMSNLSQVLALAESHFPKKVINLLEVAGVHQVMLEVRVAEMSRSLLKRLGFNFAYLSKDASHFGLSLLENLTSIPSAGFPANPIEVTQSINAILRFMSNDTTWTVFIDAMKENGLLKILAEPTLITLSGKTGNFLAGGEFPIPVPDQDGRVTIQYKPFGVGLNFTPTVLSNRKINMHVAPEVSELDFSRALTIAGFVVPSLTTRRASTTIELGDGQSFAIAGLLKDEVREVISKFPLLGDIPVLGAIFRSSSFQKNETELVIIVTPHLVKPLDMAKQTLPTDQFIEPDDFEFYLLGNIEGREKTRKPGASKKAKGHGLEGNFGHIVPK